MDFGAGSTKAPKLSFGDCVKRGTDYFNLSNALAGITGGRVGNGPISNAFLGSPISAAIDLLQGDPTDAIGHGAGSGIGKAAEALAPFVPNLYPVGKNLIPITGPGGGIPIGWRQEFEIPLKAAAKTGARTFATALEFAEFYKLPLDLAVGGFSAFICGLNY
jgi:hypothetical protein